MNKLLAMVVIGIVGWFAYTEYQSYSASYPDERLAEDSTPEADDFARNKERASRSFSCDGRMHCSQMKSCAEATYFLRNCPSIEMDGDGDGVPCESQWCGGG